MCFCFVLGTPVVELSRKNMSNQILIVSKKGDCETDAEDQSYMKLLTPHTDSQTKFKPHLIRNVHEALTASSHSFFPLGQMGLEQFSKVGNDRSEIAVSRCAKPRLLNTDSRL